MATKKTISKPAAPTNAVAATGAGKYRSIFDDQAGQGFPGAQVNHRTLKNQQAEVFRDLADAGAIAVSNRGHVDGVLLAPQEFQELRGRAAAGDRLTASLPLVLAAAAGGVAVPSEALAALGIALPFDWERLDDFLAAFPLIATHGEDGLLLPEAAAVAIEVVEEDDEELIFDHE